MPRGARLGCLPPPVDGVLRTPVERRGYDIVASLRVSVVVSTGLGNVDLARGGPGPVSIVDRHHPDGRPEPVTLGHLGNNFDSAILDRVRLLGVDACRKHWGYDGRVSGLFARFRDTVAPVRACAVGTQIYLPSWGDLAFISDGRRDEQTAILDLEILPLATGLFELAVAVRG